MITVKSPCRLSICGGGSDLPCHWRSSGGFLVTATIDKYITVTIGEGNRIKSSPQHPYALAAGWRDDDLVIIDSDIPERSGLGGSSSLMVALLRAKHPDLQPYELAMAAYHAERYTLNQPIGYQDCFAAAFGGCIAIDVDTCGRVRNWPVSLPQDFHHRLLLMSTGSSRSASNVLEQQSADIRNKTSSKEAMDQIANLGYAMYADLCHNNGRGYGQLTDQHWKSKRATSSIITNPQIDEWYELARRNGASGGKLVGAGQAGYMLFVVEPEDRFRLLDTMVNAGLAETPFRFTQEGAKVVL